MALTDSIECSVNCVLQEQQQRWRKSHRRNYWMICSAKLRRCRAFIGCHLQMSRSEICVRCYTVGVSTIEWIGWKFLLEMTRQLLNQRLSFTSLM